MLSVMRVFINPNPSISMLYLDSGVTTLPTVVRGIQLRHRREYAHPEPAYPVGVCL